MLRSKRVSPTPPPHAQSLNVPDISSFIQPLLTSSASPWAATISFLLTLPFGHLSCSSQQDLPISRSPNLLDFCHSGRTGQISHCCALELQLIILVGKCTLSIFPFLYLLKTAGTLLFLLELCIQPHLARCVLACRVKWCVVTGLPCSLLNTQAAWDF